MRKELIDKIFNEFDKDKVIEDIVNWIKNVL